ncbi:ThiF family adenylyltransferase [Oscillospiraceae bacterium OttesenSCG-928-F05]|nr:ThiF family adenylyltransferase [Oscillospiraceae bacterium OttesenSCG-928-F05]
MKYSKAAPVKIVMLGAGGTGAHIAPHLYRMLYALDRPVRFIICDGDIVESNNLVRQNFVAADLGRNKAQVLAERYASAFGLEIEYVPEYIEDPSRLAEITKPDRFRYSQYSWDDTEGHSILIGAVDNHSSRRMCDAVFRAARDLIYIDSGNNDYCGQVVCGIKRKGRTYFKPAASVYPDILDETADDKFPSELSCEEAAISAPQSIAANLMAATAVICMIYNILTVGDISVRDLYFNTNLVSIRSTTNTKRRKTA